MALNCENRYGEYCFECNQFPCERIKRLDMRYRGRYGMSEIENLEPIKEKGIEYFLTKEEKRWINTEEVSHNPFLRI